MNLKSDKKTINEIVINLINNSNVVVPVMEKANHCLITALTCLGYTTPEIRQIFLGIMNNSDIKRAYSLNSKSVNKGKSVEEAISMRIPPHIEHLKVDEQYKHRQESRGEVKSLLKILTDNSKEDLANRSYLSGKEDSNASALPNKDDVEYADSMLRKHSDETVSINSVLDRVDVNFKKAGKTLKDNWREITRRNIEIWFGKK